MQTEHSKQLRKQAHEVTLRHQLGQATKEETRIAMARILAEIKTLNEGAK